MESEKYIIEVVNAVKKYKETIEVNDGSLKWERKKN